MGMQRQDYFYGSLYRTTVQVADVFNDFNVRRYNPDYTVKEFIRVPLRVYPKKKMLFDMADPNVTYNLTFPQITLEKAGTISYRKTEDAGVLESRDYGYSDTVPISSSVFTVIQPQPITVQYKLTMWSTIESDLDQLLEAVLFWFRPYVVVRYRAPHIPADDPQSLINVKLLWDGSASLENTLDKNANLVYSATMNFEAHTYFFGDRDNGNIIYKIFSNFYTANYEDWNTNTVAETMVTFVTGGSGSYPDYSTLTHIPTGGPISGGGWTPPSGWDSWMHLGYQDKGDIRP